MSFYSLPSAERTRIIVGLERPETVMTIAQMEGYAGGDLPDRDEPLTEGLEAVTDADNAERQEELYAAALELARLNIGRGPKVEADASSLEGTAAPHQVVALTGERALVGAGVTA